MRKRQRILNNVCKWDVAFYISRIDIHSGFHFYFHFFSSFISLWKGKNLFNSSSLQPDVCIVFSVIVAEPVVNLLNFISVWKLFHHRHWRTHSRLSFRAFFNSIKRLKTSAISDTIGCAQFYLTRYSLLAVTQLDICNSQFNHSLKFLSISVVSCWFKWTL